MPDRTVKELLHNAHQQLDKFTSAKLDSELLLIHILQQPRSFLYANPEFILSDVEIKAFNTLIEQRQEGMPVAYLLGMQEFWSMPFKVTKDVLIPRADTEIVVEKVLAMIEQRAECFVEQRLLDLGTGSGCIAIALAKELPGWQITASDISAEALAIAAHNAKQNGINNINFVQSDWYDNISASRYSVIVSNPPYIDMHDPALDHDVRSYEPQQALIAEDKGLAAYKRIIGSATDYLYNPGCLVFEVGYQQAKTLEGLLDDFTDLSIERDLQGHERVISAWLQA